MIDIILRKRNIGIPHARNVSYPRNTEHAKFEVIISFSIFSYYWPFLQRERVIPEIDQNSRKITFLFLVTLPFTGKAQDGSSFSNTTILSRLCAMRTDVKRVTKNRKVIFLEF